MGWLYTHKPDSTSAVEFLKSRMEGESDKFKHEMLAGSVVNRKTAYLAMRRTNKETGKSFVYAMIVLLGYDKKSHNNFGYKDMDEFAGPYYNECPPSILKRLSPIEDIEGEVSPSALQEAVMWRESCSRFHERRKELNHLLKVGNVLEVAGPGISMNNGTAVRKMVVLSSKPLRFQSTEHGFNMKLSRDCLDRLVKQKNIWAIPV